ncbi:MAG: hypothetical protein LBT55_02415 [Clostridiaceae bacterium]|nr:hypothetical protein [Clostridiaceae bacterium]
MVINHAQETVENNNDVIGIGEHDQAIKKSVKALLLIICELIVLVLWLVLTAVTIVLSIGAFKNDRVVKLNNKREAKITDITYFDNAAIKDRESARYLVWYSYLDENGKEYQGNIEINGEEKANSMLNQVVIIYIDGEGYSIYEGSYDKKASTRGPIIASACLILTIGTALLLIITARRYKYGKR